MFKLDTIKGHDRMSTQDLLLAIGSAVADGETDFEIAASGQHDIGGPLWHPEGKKLHFHVTNAGQRLGSMCLNNTEIIADGSVSADVGWLNAGGKIIVNGDAGDTAGHCSAGGKIYIGGRGGTRTGSLMKHDPLYEEPELWILKNVGSFSFEFMGGGRAVVCGFDSENFTSVLGERPCVGMVGGTVYFRGLSHDHPADIMLEELNDNDITFLNNGMDEFLASINKLDLRTELSDWKQWHKLSPLSFETKQRQSVKHTDMKTFRSNEWIKGGMFSDVAVDDFAVKNLVEKGLYRQRVPMWNNAKYAAPCEFACPAHIPTQLRYKMLRKDNQEEAVKLILEYTPFPGSVCASVCPNPCMEACTRGKIDEAVQIGSLGFQSVYTKITIPDKKTGKKIAVIGGGVAGLGAAWQLIQRGHSVTVYDDADAIGGKLEQVIPRARLSHELLQAELKRIETAGVKFVPKCKIDKDKFTALQKENDAVILATGGHKSRYFPWEGAEKLIMGLSFLKAVNRGEHPKVGKNVIVIGCGNSGMDTARGAYDMGAETVTCIDVQKPAAFANEIDHIEKLGGKLIWPFMTTKITDEGIYDNTGRFVKGDMVIVSIGEAPILDYLPQNEQIKKFRDWLVPAKDNTIMDGVFAAGDIIKPGRLVDAIGSGNKAAYYADAYVMQKSVPDFPEKKEVPAQTLGKEFFEKYHHDDIPEPTGDVDRCVSCGTCRDCKTCQKACPEKAIDRIDHGMGIIEYKSNPAKCIGCGICAGICPCGIWELKANDEPIKMYRTGETK
ncbi:FAD-dependent oxidoreductase [Pectinatus sottacetonis]|uniref:FAD-dependent oxidoreductase n=1 Tax=Pectinatus sottacetonis TaxID=1002795 RepID=UPI0018C6223A|nr:FAD-dependent oxidoreductase [Pectinatus sottacetonis]